MSTKLIAQKIYEDVKIKRFKSELRIERTGNIEVSEKITCVYEKSTDNPVFVRKISSSNIQIKSLTKDKQSMVYESVIWEIVFLFISGIAMIGFCRERMNLKLNIKLKII